MFKLTPFSVSCDFEFAPTVALKADELELEQGNLRLLPY